jgi:uncharacterized protein
MRNMARLRAITPVFARLRAIGPAWAHGWVVLALCAWAWATALSPAWAQALVPVPALTARVMDQTGTLAAADVAALEQQLKTFEQQRGTQIVVLLVPTTAPEDIADFTQRLGDTWKIGRHDVGDGLLLVVALNDKRLRIAPAKALEGAVPDLAAQRIIEQVISPAFRQGDVAGGLRAGLTHLQARIEGEALPLPDPSAERANTGGVDWLDLTVLLLVAVPLVASVLRSVLGNRLGSMAAAGAAGFLAWNMTGLWWLAVLAGMAGLMTALFMQALPSAPLSRSRHRGGDGGIASSGGWGRGSHGSWGGSGGGGFTSGGGGDFGGGGASGSW